MAPKQDQSYSRNTPGITLSKMKRANFEKISPFYSRTGCKFFFSQECKIHKERCVRMPMTCERELMITWPWRVPFRSLRGPLRRPLPGDGLEASLDGLHGAFRLTRHALKEPHPCLLVEDGVWRAAGVACHKLLDVSPEDVLYVLLLEAALEDELVVAVDGRAGGTQLGSEEGQQMLGLTMQHFGDLSEVDEGGLLGADL